jgi:hypothetical protein
MSELNLCPSSHTLPLRFTKGYKIRKNNKDKLSFLSILKASLLLLFFFYIKLAEEVSCPDALAVSLDVCSNVFAELTPILENSFTLSLAF